ncbi:hypothetical protein HYW94_02550, partial [Candidatus Uhrbacteria bacterium]|nr:hypothetical protein [Candidatus Uhrbacteria bacterium]
MKKFFERFTYGITVLSVIFWSLGPAAFPLQANAIITTLVSDATGGSLKLKATSGLKEAVKIQFGADANGTELNQIFASFIPANGKNPVFTSNSVTSSDLANLATGGTSGVSLWKDVAKNGFTGAGDDVNVSLFDMPFTYAAPNLTGIATFPITPSASTPIATDDIFYIAVQSKATPVDQNAFSVKLIQSAIVAGGSALTVNQFQTQPIVIDTTAPTIVSFNGGVGTAGAQLRFNEPVQKVGGGNITWTSGTDPFTYVDVPEDGEAAQSTTALSHTAGTDFVNLTFSRNLTSNDLSNTIAPAANKIMDMVGNIAAVNPARTMENPISISSSSLSSGLAGSVYTATLAGSGGMGAKAWLAADSQEATKLTNLGLSLHPVTGTLSGTIPSGAAGNYVNFKYRDDVTTATVTTGAAGANAWTMTAGNYTPALGDIVLYRNITDAPTVAIWGVVTNAT